MEKERLWSREYVSLITSQTLTSFGFQMVSTVLPLYLLQYGSSESQIGFIMGSFAFSAFLIRPISPVGIKWIGKKNYLLFGIFITLLAALGYCLTASADNVLFARISRGLGFGIATTMMATLVADSIPDSRRGEGIGLFGVANTIAMSTAPLFALSIVANNDFSWVFLMSAASLLTSLVWIKFAFNPKPLYPWLHHYRSFWCRLCFMGQAWASCSPPCSPG